MVLTKTNQISFLLKMDQTKEFKYNSFDINGLNGCVEMFSLFKPTLKSSKEDGYNFGGGNCQNYFRLFFDKRLL